MLKFLYSRTQNVAGPMCPGPPLNWEVWIWSQVSSFGICDVHYVTWTGFSPSICVFPCQYHSSSAPCSFHLRSSTLYHLGSWHRCEITHRWRIKYSIPLGCDAVSDERFSTFRRIVVSSTSWEKQSKNPRQHRHENLRFRILKSFNAKLKYPIGLSGSCDIDVELWGLLEYALSVQQKGADWTGAKATYRAVVNTVMNLWAL